MTTATLDLKQSAELKSARASMLNPGAILAVWRRQLGSLLLNPLGYCFLLVFVLASGAVLFWPDAYFQRNIADLGPLITYMPWLLVILLPTLAMNSWALERELGTEEQLLTLPLSPADALIGKWLAVASYFTLALIFSAVNVIVLAWLGRPDVGLIAGNYLGWWFAGLVFASLGILASTLVSLPALAFVIGVALCAIMMGIFWTVDYFDPFNRGLLPLGRIVSSLVLVALGLGLAALLLSMRRWQRARRGMILTQCVVFAALCVTGINLGVLADRASADVDVTAEKLSSLSPASRKVLGEVSQPVKIVAFISQNLPPELQPKAKEVENTLKTLARAMPQKLDLQIQRPADALDPAGSQATQYYGIEPRKVPVSNVTGRTEAEVFLSAIITSGTRQQKIEYFDQGLSVEYELVRAVRAVGDPKKKVIGVARSDISMLGGFDFQTRSQSPRWQVVREWEKQYDVREVNLDVEVSSDIDVLVAPQPSRLEQPQLEHLHDYIWSGRPTLVMEDPLPLNSPSSGTSQQKRPANPMMPPQEEMSKADIRPLLASIGIVLPEDQIVWSDFNPSPALRSLPKGLVWSLKDHKAINPAAATTGIQSVLLPYPGMVQKSPDNGDLKITTLLTPVPASAWGATGFDENFRMNPFMGMSQTTPNYFASSGEVPALAVEITGTMKRAYPLPQPSTQPTTSPTTEPSTQPAAPPPPTGIGKASEKPIHVIFIADTDLASDQFYEIYRNVGNEFGAEELRFLQSLGNVQFLANAIDALAGDQDFLELRTRRPQRRPLAKLEDVFNQTQAAVRQVEDSARSDAKIRIGKLQSDLDSRVQQINERKDLDENARRQLEAQVQRAAQRQLDVDRREINRQADQKIRDAEIQQQRQYEAVLNNVRLKALGVPALFLAALALTVYGVRQRGEQLVIPESRRRK
jgi:ABC-2 type transport system permease protein